MQAIFKVYNIYILACRNETTAMNRKTNSLINTNLSVGSRILKIPEFDLKILD